MAESRFLGPIHIHDHGGTGPLILLIHGLGGSYNNWSRVGHSLAGHGHTVAMDLPGFGLSGPARNHDLQAHVGAVHRTIDVLGTPATLCGNSMGGLVAMLATSTRPDLVNKMVLVAPAAPLRPRRLPSNRLIAAQLAFQSIPEVGPALSAWYRHRLTPRQQVALTLGFITARPESIAPEVIDEATDLAEIRRGFPWASRSFTESAASVRG